MAELMEYKCPACGGALEFDPKTQKLVCPYCDSVFDVSQLQGKDDALGDGEIDPDQMEQIDPDSAEPLPDDYFDWNTDAGSEWNAGEADGMRVYVCQSCGGEIIVDATTAASSCPFCDNPVVMTGNLSGSLKPDLILPFKVDKKTAKEALRNHVKGKKLVPKLFSNENHLDEIKGVYVPYWLFDSSADADLRFRTTRTRAWSDQDYNYVDTESFLVERSGTIDFEAIPVDGSSKMNDTLMESLEPYDVHEAVPFQTAYLAGYLADKYDVTADQSVDRANERAKKTAESAFASHVHGYETVTLQSSSVRLKKSSVRYALYPVWLLNTTWQGQKYVFAMNGQTGKFVGDLPMDKHAYRKYLLRYGVIFGVIAYILVTVFKML